MAESTRQRFLDAALTLFAERGFDGVSIAAIAQALGLSKQALLHHFSSKEKLYGELLANISREFQQRIDEVTPTDRTPEALVSLFLALAADGREHPDQTALLMRELLDNGARARRAGHWYLKPFLDSLSERLRALPAWQNASEAQSRACIYQFLGAINYFAISRDTLQAMYGERGYAAMERVFEVQLSSTIRSTVLAGPGATATA